MDAVSNFSVPVSHSTRQVVIHNLGVEDGHREIQRSIGKISLETIDVHSEITYNKTVTYGPMSITDLTSIR